MLINNAHLTYCTNIHSGESWQEHFSALQKCFPGIKREISPDKPMGIGLRLSHIASLELIEENRLHEFIGWLESQSAYVFTMNGFPYGSFHHVRVKDQVHAPDWTTAERVDYTMRLFKILAKLLPEGLDGGISTSPLSYRYWFDPSTDDRLLARHKATKNILKVLELLLEIKRETGKTLHLDIEPEPDGLLETGDEFIQWFEEDLLPMALEDLSDQGLIASDIEILIREHIRLCYDVCHFAIGYESHREVVEKLTEKGIRIGKIQISAALKADLEKSDVERKLAYRQFAAYNESTYLHQVVARMKDNSLLRYRDLPDALDHSESELVAEWRAHFHVPLFAEDFGVLKSTNSEIVEVLNLQKEFGLTSHLEVETYTWEVLPEVLKLPLEDSIIRELQWVKHQLNRI